PDRPGARICMAFHIRNRVGTRDDRSFAVQGLACAPLPRVRPRPCERRCTAQGRCGSPLLGTCTLYSLPVSRLKPRTAACHKLVRRWRNRIVARPLCHGRARYVIKAKTSPCGRFVPTRTRRAFKEETPKCHHHPSLLRTFDFAASRHEPVSCSA